MFPVTGWPYGHIVLLDAGCVLCPAVRGPVCSACAARFVGLGSFDSPGLDRCRSAFVLDTNLLHVIASLKYRGERRAAKWLAGRMAPLVPLAADVITWVPTTNSALRRRGYDHGHELARLLGSHAGIRCRRLLNRRGETRQTGRSRAQRISGPDVVATGPPKLLAGSFVVVVDDVTTTGASLRVAAEQLRRSGALRVVGLTAARTPRDVTSNPV